MIVKPSQTMPMGDPAAFEIGSPQSRAAARAMLAERRNPASMTEADLDRNISEVCERLGFVQCPTADELQRQISETRRSMEA